MDALDCLKTRRSVRAFRTDPIPKEIIEDVLDHARFSPSAHNEQPWEFVVVTEQELLQRIADLTEYGKHIGSAAACVAVFCRPTTFYLEDGSAVTMAILLAAWAHGLGSCWVAGDKTSHAAEVGRLLQVPAEHRLVSLIPIGYPADQAVKPKHPLNRILHWERYGQRGSLHPSDST